MTVVVDASVVVDILLGRPRASPAIGLLAARDQSHAPELLVVEVLHVLRRHRLRGLLSRAEADEHAAALRDLPIALHGMTALAPAAWALTDTLTAYDAAYVALAQALDAPLLTLDERLAREAASHVQIASPADR